MAMGRLWVSVRARVGLISLMSVCKPCDSDPRPPTPDPRPPSPEPRPPSPDPDPRPPTPDPDPRARARAPTPNTVTPRPDRLRFPFRSSCYRNATGTQFVWLRAPRRVNTH